LQPGRGVLATALRREQPLELLVDPVLRQARLALVEVLGEQPSARLVALVVEEEPHLGEDLGAVGLVVVATAHDETPSSCRPRRNPRSRAVPVSKSLSCRLPRCSRDI